MNEDLFVVFFSLLGFMMALYYLKRFFDLKEKRF